MDCCLVRVVYRMSTMALAGEAKQFTPRFNGLGCRRDLVSDRHHPPSVEPPFLLFQQALNNEISAIALEVRTTKTALAERFLHQEQC
ncbi:MAG: hypothetical protein HY785_14000 [Oscillatoriophycideae cyanobacterium NC_groundwater_1537_Pr4_S-0.65um_50_18]|nr:hypothetical protein [Oscillatoriophycideae cyanobacterium NC_groundwater_1537_Pr4_S-0.65um_50_18]